MKNSKFKNLYWSILFIFLFIVWTILIGCVDVAEIGPNKSIVGFAKVNKFVCELTGTHMSLYVITDWLSLIPIAFIIGFGLLGLIQCIKRKSVTKVDKSILTLGAYYIIVFGVYILFEFLVINHRPILINGVLEASYPSSTTMLVMCVMPTTAIQLNRSIKNNKFKKTISVLTMVFTVFMVTMRLISGVHWFSDIIGGLLISISLLFFYCFISKTTITK